MANSRKSATGLVWTWEDDVLYRLESAVSRSIPMEEGTEIIESNYSILLSSISNGSRSLKTLDKVIIIEDLDHDISAVYESPTGWLIALSSYGIIELEADKSSLIQFEDDKLKLLQLLPVQSKIHGLSEQAFHEIDPMTGVQKTLLSWTAPSELNFQDSNQIISSTANRLRILKEDGKWEECEVQFSSLSKSGQGYFSLMEGNIYKNDSADLCEVLLFSKQNLDHIYGCEVGILTRTGNALGYISLDSQVQTTGSRHESDSLIYLMDIPEQAVVYSHSNHSEFLIKDADDLRCYNLQNLLRSRLNPKVNIISIKQSGNKIQRNKTGLALSQSSTLTIELSGSLPEEEVKYSYRYRINHGDYSEWQRQNQLSVNFNDQESGNIETQCKTLDGRLSDSMIIPFHVVKEKNQSPIIFSLIGLVILLLLFAIAWNQRKRKRNEEDEKQKQAKIQKNKLLELEQKALQLQMNPHFIFNSLQSIRAKLGTKDPSVVDREITRFSGLMRDFLNHSRSQKVSLEEEVGFLTSYLQLEKDLRSDSFVFEFTGSALEESAMIEIPPLTIQPFIENALIHGIDNSPRKGKIKINLIAEENFFTAASKTME